MSKATIYVSGVFIGFDLEGKPLSYGSVEFRDHDTGEIIYTYENADRTQVNENPVPLSSAGKASIFLDGGDYDIVLRDQYETIIETLINFSPGAGDGLGGGGSFQGGYTPELGAEYPEDDPDIYGDFWSLKIPWTFSTGDLAGQDGNKNDLVIWSVNGWQLFDLGFDLDIFLRIDGQNDMEATLDMGVHRIINMDDGINDRDGVTLRQLTALLDDIWTQSEFIDQSEGVTSAGLPIKTNAQGNLDASFLEIDLFVYRGTHDPRGEEYPSTVGLNAGDFYSIDLPEGTTYTYTTGNLIGEVVEEGDALVFVSAVPDERWGLININLDPTQFINIDGTIAMEANLAMGNHRITNLLPGDLDNDAVTVGQMQAQASIPAGIIVMWAGNVADVPAGWRLYTELNDRFVLATTQSSQIGNIGGSNVATMPAHSHGTTDHQHWGGDHQHETPAHTHTGGTDYESAHTHSYNQTVSSVGIGVGGTSTGLVSQSNTTGAGGGHSHNLTIATGGSGITVLGGGAFTDMAGAGATESAGGTGDNQPAFYKLAYIIKI